MLALQKKKASKQGRKPYQLDTLKYSGVMSRSVVMKRHFIFQLRAQSQLA